MDSKNEWEDVIQKWLQEHDNDDAEITQGRHVIPDSIEEILDTDTPEEIEREKARTFSLRWGWIWDFFSALYWWIRDWFTVDVVGGLFRALSVLVIAALLFAIIYNIYIAKTLQPRVLPTIEELMKPAYEQKEGSPTPQEGSR